ncbi:MAG TPA: hypothetical protein VMU68_09380 [Acidimicrobiales bacterium]|nr:hypothetical protein [Acidimicrobiales bacterium]
MSIHGAGESTRQPDAIDVTASCLFSAQRSDEVTFTPPHEGHYSATLVAAVRFEELIPDTGAKTGDQRTNLCNEGHGPTLVHLRGES